ncbi:hypothetical protein MKZ38_005256 [Zalerion maritima]|uniref:Uncharacterized protein n=1 Tax=Zalerion maritima TaxID=339359 RepID=A0AAD5RLF3_9PEZI|nr:hypothetical protein MKZ38_005256 [Zalerion maritima]
MTATTHNDFNANTEGVEVATAFADGIRGRTIILTGVNRGGLGYSAANAFASQAPAKLIIAGRNPNKIQGSIDALKADHPSVTYRPLIMDLSSQRSVRSAAAEVLSWSDIPTVDFLINSAGIMGEPTRELSDEGIEMHFATNHIGHFLFTCLVMPKLIAAAEGRPKGTVRVVNVSSGSPCVANMRWTDINFDKKNKDLALSEQPPYEFLGHWGYGTKEKMEEMTYIPVQGYNQSKVANLLFAIGLTSRLYDRHGILSLTVHPGVIQTELGRNIAKATLAAVGDMLKKGVFTYKSMGAGSSTALVAALDPKLGPGEGKTNHGAFLDNCQISDQARPECVGSEEAERLWSLSEELVKQKFVW